MKKIYVISGAIVAVLVIAGALIASGALNAKPTTSTNEMTPMSGVEVIATGPSYLTTSGQLVVPINITNTRTSAIDLAGLTFTMVFDNGSKASAYFVGTSSIPPGYTASLLVAINSPIVVNVTVINIVQDNQYVNCTVPAQPAPPKAVSALDRIEAKGKIVMWTEATFLPFEAYDPASNTCYGFDIDLAYRITENVSAQLGVPIVLEIQDRAFSTIPSGLQNNQTDMSLSGMTITDERNTSVMFSTPYYMADAGFGMLVRGGDNSLNSVDDLTSASSIVVNTGTTSEQWVQKTLVDTGLYPANKVKSLPTIAGCAQDVQIGQSQVFIIDKPTAETYAAHSSGALKVSAVIPSYEPYGVAMNKGATDLKEIVDRVITEMIANGEMEALQAKWGLA